MATKMHDPNNNLTLRAAGAAPELPTLATLNDLAEREDFEQILEEHFPKQARVYKQSGMDRRSFLKLMGSSLALGGLTLAGCVPAAVPGEQIVPYVQVPEEMIPGRPLFFASTQTQGGFGTGVLIETHSARPTRLEGNPNHPASLGGSSSMVQASILDMYDPERSTQVRNAGSESTWEAYLEALNAEIGRAGRSNGAGLRILTETITSPTLGAQVNALLERYPEAAWYQYEPVNQDNVVAGARLAFDQDVNTIYDFAQADVVVSLDADFLQTMPGSLRYARDFAAGRRVRLDADASAAEASMSRHFAVESSPTITGANADHRLALRAGEVQVFARALANALGVPGGEVNVALPFDEAFLNAIVAELEANRGRSLVVAGPQQPPVVHALAHAINGVLGNVGTTVNYAESPLVNPTLQSEDLTTLVNDLNAGGVDTLVILGGNPVFNTPADVDFAAALSEASFSVHLSLYYDETSQLCTWHIPTTHFVEEWGDVRAYDGSASLIQPPSVPYYDTARSAIEFLAVLNQDDRAPYDILVGTWQENYSGDEPFELYWRRARHDGVVPDSALASVEPALRGDFADVVGDLNAAPVVGIEVNFRPDPAVWDGRYAQNAWLQELPDPITKVAWDNTVQMNQATADSIGVEQGELVEIRYAGRTLRVPALISPMHPDDSVTIYLGYGHRLSADLEAGQNFNAYNLRTLADPWFGNSAELIGTNSIYPLAVVREPQHWEGLHPLKSGNLATFQGNPTFVDDIGEKKPESDLLPDFPYEGYAWGMSIDLSACTGCSACMIACSLENTVPVVGKTEVLNARDMSWIRIDRHYEDDHGEMRVNFQPVACVHCEKAPCEQVCPVQATVHDHEGLNLMVYNRCVGTRYCSANCPYGVRRFNFFGYSAQAPAIAQEWRNPNVSVRPEGVMEKCTYCVQRIYAAKIAAGRENRPVRDGEIVPACAGACPSQAITFGDINNAAAAVMRDKNQPHNYGLLAELNTKPRTSYIARLFNPSDALFSAGAEEA